jgi:hypothetical protein
MREVKTLSSVQDMMGKISAASFKSDGGCTALSSVRSKGNSVVSYERHGG